MVVEWAWDMEKQRFQRSGMWSLASPGEPEPSWTWSILGKQAMGQGQAVSQRSSSSAAHDTSERAGQRTAFLS